MALKKPVQSERNRKNTDVRAPKAEINSDIAGPSSLTPKKPIPKQKKRKYADGKAPEALNTRSSSKRKWGNDEEETLRKNISSMIMAGDQGGSQMIKDHR